MRSERLVIAAGAAGVALLVAALSFDWSALLSAVHFPAGEMTNRWVRVDLATLRVLAGAVGALLVGSAVALRRRPALFDQVLRALDRAGIDARASRLAVPLALAVVALGKTVLQLGLYLVGYTVYAADDFSRSLSAAYWLRYHRLDLGMEGFLGTSGSGWLPLPDYLFGAALGLHDDLFLTPKLLNLAISGLLVIGVYLLGREVFGRRVGIVTAAVFAFHPWHIWLGLSGMTSDLPSVLLIVGFGFWLCRWLRTERPSALLAAAAFLAVATGFRYENWFFAAVFGIVLLAAAGSRWRQGRLSMRWSVEAGAALMIVGVIPALWMTASYARFGDWLPALHTNVANYYDIAFASGSRAPKATISMALLAAGAFPLELALSIAGVAAFLARRRRVPVAVYAAVPFAALAVFAVVVKGRLPAYLMCGRYFLPYVALMLPFAGYLIVELVAPRAAYRREALASAAVLVAAVALLDVGRSFNYPAMFPPDALGAGRLVRSLQQMGTIPGDEKVLVERAADWGDLGVVALANRPERFVALTSKGMFATDPTHGGSLRLTAAGDRGGEEPCAGSGFDDDTCRRLVVEQRFGLVILSTPDRVASFARAFHPASWTVGRYHIFDMSSRERRAEVGR